MRLIDADALRDALGITGTEESCKGCQYNKRFNFACNTDDAPSFAYVCEAIDEAPTIATEPVCLCKDCLRFERNHWETVNGIPLIVGHNICNGWGGGCQTDPEGYCFMAERKEE
jgi:hypothetical protein